MFKTLISKSIKGLAVVGVLTASATAALANAAVYQQAVRSTAWVISPINKEKGDSFGSGVLVDTQRRLVVTNYHVVENRKDAIVFFPTFQDGEPNSLRSFYVNNASSLAIKGKVLAAEPARDLAVIQLERLPEGAQAIPLAPRSISAGTTIHVIGNSDVNGGTLWRYSNGFVRGVFPKTFKTGSKVVKEFTLSARIVESQIPSNPGDSGGPVVNDQGELVAIHQGNNPTQQLVSFGVDINEVRAILAGLNRPRNEEVATRPPIEEVAAVEDETTAKSAPSPRRKPAAEEAAVEDDAPVTRGIAPAPKGTTPAPKVEDVPVAPAPVQAPPARQAPVVDTPVAPKAPPVVEAPPVAPKAPPVKVIVPKKAVPCGDKPCHQPQWGYGRRCH